MDAITNIIPTPRPLRIEAAGVTVMVSEFTLRDMADLQAILDGLNPDPLFEIGQALADLPADDRRGRLKLLQAAWRKADAGPPVYGEPSGQDYFATTEGLSLLVWVALRRHNPQVTPEVATELVDQMKPWEFGQLFRAAHGQSTRRTLEHMLYPLPCGGRSGNKRTWGQAIEDVIQSHPGWTYATVYNMTFTEFANALHVGKPPSEDIQAPAGVDPEIMLAEMRYAFGLIADEPSAASSGSLPQQAAQDDGRQHGGRPDEPMAETV